MARLFTFVGVVWWEWERTYARFVAFLPWFYFIIFPFVIVMPFQILYIHQQYNDVVESTKKNLIPVAWRYLISHRIRCVVAWPSFVLPNTSPNFMLLFFVQFLLYVHFVNVLYDILVYFVSVVCLKQEPRTWAKSFENVQF